ARIVDGEGDIYDYHYEIEVYLDNYPPVISSEPVLNVQAGNDYVYQVVATDPENQPLAYSLNSSPPGMSIGAINGLVTYHPNANAAGSYPVVIRVTDSQDAFVLQEYTLMITAPTIPNRPPELIDFNTPNAIVDFAYSYQVNITDPDGDVLNYYIVSGPDG